MSSILLNWLRQGGGENPQETPKKVRCSFIFPDASSSPTAIVYT